VWLWSLMLWTTPRAAQSAPEPTPTVDQSVAAAEAWVAQLRADEQTLAALFDAQQELERTITARKAAGDRGSPDLKAALRASVTMEERLQTTLDHRDAVRGRAEAAIEAGLRGSDRAIRRSLPALRRGSRSERRQAAERIQRLRRLRARLSELKATIESNPVSVLQWKDLALAPSPLDGPEDLRDKADFVEDARDKIQAKREELARLWRRARQDKAIGRAAREFAVDVTLFDEEARSPRVQQARAPTTGREPTAGGGGGGGQRQPASDDESVEGDGADFDSEGIGGSPVAPGFSPPNLDADAPPTSDPTPEAPSGPGPSPSPPTTPDPTPGGGATFFVPQELTPNYLLSLRVDDLSSHRVDLETLERILEQLEQMDAVLAARALSMRKKAEALEAEP
jgi:hypothetical protein